MTTAHEDDQTELDPDVGDGSVTLDEFDDDVDTEEHFKPTGTLFILVMFVITLILLWVSVYVILLSRGVTA